MILYFLIILAVLYGVFGLILSFRQSSFLYNPYPQVLYDPGDVNLAFEKVTFTTEDGLRLTGWHIPAKGTNVTILFCHANSGNMSHRLDSIAIFNKLGMNCFIFDYRGYGNSDGKCSEAGTYLDAAAAYKWLTEEKNINGDDIILFGRSLGGSIAAELAQNVEARALVLESSFTSYVDIGKKYYPYVPVRLFARFRYHTIDYVKNVRCPIMIVHSRNDEVIPFEFGLRLYEAANEPKKFVEIFGSHNEGFLHSGKSYKKNWSQWLDLMIHPQWNK